MIVIADTSPLNYLVLIGEAEILQRLYGRVVIPEVVLRELQHPQTPTAEAEWVNHCPVRHPPMARYPSFPRGREGSMTSFASWMLSAYV